MVRTRKIVNGEEMIVVSKVSGLRPTAFEGKSESYLNPQISSVQLNRNSSWPVNGTVKERLFRAHSDHLLFLCSQYSQSIPSWMRRTSQLMKSRLQWSEDRTPSVLPWFSKIPFPERSKSESYVKIDRGFDESFGGRSLTGPLSVYPFENPVM